ncbi:MEDS domain-containing protein [Cryptosporangium aurantiacum]|uniref:STAS domain-containing protein n=1 Tax=Cryptosporangium aurantiacum TaxID=134849 RepID=A0A1M7RGM6_9ACTN|nr:MEDS domain-containing protein [Cryptosporangium aurantiacum]SHN45198.1 STAS domain-containing protein [Cryptosporangium aurantiacum]
MTGVAMAARLELGDHVCSFVDGPDDGLDLMAHTVAAGLHAGDRVLLFAESLSPIAVLTGLEERGVATAEARHAGQVQVLPAREAYLPAGRFEAARMLDDLAGHIDQAGRDGYRGLRIVGDMAWALTEPAGIDELPRYEACVNSLFMDEGSLALCLYDRRTFPRELLRRVACSHPASAAPEVDPGWTPLLRIRRTTDPYGLRLTGESDLSNRQSLAAALDAVLEQQPDPAVPILIDVAGLEFADAATAAVLGRLAVRAPSGVQLAGPRAAVATVLDHLGFAEVPELDLTCANGAVA